jgi:hypothetical protein
MLLSKIKSLMSNNRAFRENSQFLLELLLSENKHFNPIDFLDKSNQASNFACVCVSMGIAQEMESMRNNFFDENKFFETYFNIYSTALENYKSITSGTLRQITFDEANVFYPMVMDKQFINKLVSNQQNKNTALSFIDQIKQSHSFGIILRDSIAFIIIHHQNDDYIVIDPHIEYCGILSKNNVYRYVVYDGIWDLDVYILGQFETKPIDTKTVPPIQPFQPLPPTGPKPNSGFVTLSVTTPSLTSETPELKTDVTSDVPKINEIDSQINNLSIDNN